MGGGRGPALGLEPFLVDAFGVGAQDLFGDRIAVELDEPLLLLGELADTTAGR